jgi:hypothetical protein
VRAAPLHGCGLLNRHGMVGSMERVSAASHNAARESFFSLLQKFRVKTLAGLRSIEMSGRWSWRGPGASPWTGSIGQLAPDASLPPADRLLTNLLRRAASAILIAIRTVATVRPSRSIAILSRTLSWFSWLFAISLPDMSSSANVSRIG